MTLEDHRDLQHQSHLDGGYHQIDEKGFNEQQEHGKVLIETAVKESTEEADVMSVTIVLAFHTLVESMMLWSKGV